MLNILNVIFWFQERFSVQFGGITSNQEDGSYKPPHGQEGKKAWVVRKLLVLVLVGTSGTGTGTSGGKVTVLSGVERGRWEALELSAMSSFHQQ